MSGIRVSEGKGCAFATFQTRAAAEKAMEVCQGVQVGLYRIRLEWGRSGSAVASSSRAVQQGPAAGSAGVHALQHFGPPAAVDADSMPPGVPLGAVLVTCRPPDTGVPPAGHPALRFFAAQAQAQAAGGGDAAADPLQRPLVLPGFITGGATPQAAVARLPAAAAAQRVALREAAAAAVGRAGAGDAGDEVAARNLAFGAVQAAVRFSGLLITTTPFTSSGAQALEGTVMASL